MDRRETFHELRNCLHQIAMISGVPVSKLGSERIVAQIMKAGALVDRLELDSASSQAGSGHNGGRTA